MQSRWNVRCAAQTLLRRAALAAATGWICAAALPGVAQTTSKPQLEQHASAAGPAQPPSPLASASDPNQKANQQIEAQCAELFQMAVGLKAEVDKTTKDMLSVSVVRKADAIEQLAHKVRDEMKPRVKTP